MRCADRGREQAQGCVICLPGHEHRHAAHTLPRTASPGSGAPLPQASTPAEVNLWEGVLRDSFGALKSFSFLDTEKAEGIMKR